MNYKQYTKHFNFLCSLLKKQFPIFPKECIEDVISDVIEQYIIKFCPEENNFNFDKTTLKWIFCHSKDKLRYEFRKNQKYQFQSISETEILSLTNLNPEEIINIIDLESTVDEIIKKIPLIYREVLNYLLVGYDCKEISLNLGISLYATQKRIQRLRKYLRIYFKQK